MLAADQLHLLSAALRHQEDAEALLGSSPDQSWHLAGYATECVRKAALSVAAYRLALAHEQGPDFDALFDLAVALDPGATRLRLQGWAPSGSRLAAWRAQHRYDQRGVHVDGAAALVHETAAHHDRTLTALWLAHPFDLGCL